MKTIFLSLTLVTAALCTAACGGSGNKDVSTSMNENDSASVAEEPMEEVLQPIGDRARYQVHGNVNSITFVQGCEKFKTTFEPWHDDEEYDAKVKQKVLAFIKECSITHSVTFDEAGKGISSHQDFYTPNKSDEGTTYTCIFYDGESDYAVDYNLACMYGGVYTYDHNGKLIYTGGIDWGTSYEYDEHGYLVKESGGGEGGYGFETAYTYDEDGNCVKEQYEETEFDEVTESSVTTYTILEKDNRGNWTKRKSSKGEIDERTITYY
ncbi:MAG: hypothetical protein IJP75_12495 [Bacteroidaceae bacterium]|nr:hypothetical protein [Bacteroidaceae bacterium]